MGCSVLVGTEEARVVGVAAGGQDATVTVIRVSELGSQDGGRAFRVKVSFGDEAEYPVTVTDPGDEAIEKSLAWYFEEHLRYPFLDKDLEQQAVSQIGDYGTALGDSAEPSRCDDLGR